MSPHTFYALLEFAPWKYDATKYATADKIEHEDVWIELDDGTKLHGWYFPVADSKKTVIVHHGQGGNVTLYLSTPEVFHNSGASCLMYDYEGFGRSEGTPSNAAVQRDAEAAYWFIRNNKKVAPENIVHCGLSLGTGAASFIATKQPCAGVILISPYLRLSKVAVRILPILAIYPSFAFPQPDIGSEEFAKTKTVPLLIVHSTNDPALPIEQAEEIFAMYRGPKEFFRVPNGSHIGGLAPGVESVCQKWLTAL